MKNYVTFSNFYIFSIKIKLLHTYIQRFASFYNIGTFDRLASGEQDNIWEQIVEKTANAEWCLCEGMSISIRRFVALLPVYPACGGPKENLQVSWLGDSKLSSRCMQLFLFICLFLFWQIWWWKGKETETLKWKIGNRHFGKAFGILGKSQELNLKNMPSSNP